MFSDRGDSLDEILLKSKMRKSMRVDIEWPKTKMIFARRHTQRVSEAVKLGTAKYFHHFDSILCWLCDIAIYNQILLADY